MIPNYYSRLAPFRDLFRSGCPVLTYHHVGPRRRGARLKGLYLSSPLFARQLEEFQSAGFSTDRLQHILKLKTQPESGSPPRVWLTFDDGFVDVFNNALPLLQTSGRMCGAWWKPKR